MLLDINIAARQSLALITPIASFVLTAPTMPTVPRQLSPDRPEVLMQAYLTEKEAWLA